MRFAQLRAGFAAIVMAGCCGAGPEPTDEMWAIDTSLPAYNADVNACRADDLACRTLCERLIGPSANTDEYLVIEDCFLDETGPKTAEVTASYYWAQECISGRRPPGLVGHGAGSWLVACARLEAASVPAFLRTAHELARADAPAALIAEARRAARDEVRHARAIAALARRAGHALAPVVIAPSPLRSLADLAEDNAAEGCARETYGALVATHQARRAQAPAIRAALAPIARDETRHAAFSFALDRWARTRLSRTAARRLTDARRAALTDLQPTAPDALLGLPGPQLVGDVRRLLG